METKEEEKIPLNEEIVPPVVPNEIVITKITDERVLKAITTYEENKDLNINIQNSILTFGNLIVGLIIGYIAIKAVFSHWK